MTPREILNEAVGVLSDHDLARITGISRLDVHRQRYALRYPPVKSGNWRRAVDKWGADGLMERLLAWGASKELVESATEFLEFEAELRKPYQRKSAKDQPVKTREPRSSTPAGTRARKRFSGEKLKPDEVALKQELDAAGWSQPKLPKSRDACRGGPRPCPLVRCCWHLALDIEVNPVRSIQNDKNIKKSWITTSILANPKLLEDPASYLASMPETCALDVAEANEDQGVSLEDIADMMEVSRERIRQVQDAAQAKIKDHPALGRMLEELGITRRS